ncbi:MAG TPA: pitrilysin family protein [Sphingobacteriaceae bacterium]|nr:pitrilysin family protein [Sphingobacteriaceae bacterium]
MIQTHELANGLQIVTRESRRVPVVAIFMWYRVGSRNEVPGSTGISHWVEHMQFNGTPRYPKGRLDQLVTSKGGQWNGFTWLDFTAYFEVMPKEHLDLMLDMEADRMTNSLFDPEQVEKERTVIISERQGSENYPGFWLQEAVQSTAYHVHPYRQSVIGTMGDLRSITRDELYQHYRRYYVPNNAILVAVGDFDTEHLLSRVEHFFGNIPRGPEPPEVRPVEPKQHGERRVTVRRPGPAPYMQVVYHIPAADHPDLVPLLVADGILSGGKAVNGHGGGTARTSRLYRRLVDTGLATRAGTYLMRTRDPGLFGLHVSLQPGADVDEVEKAAFEEIDKLGREEPEAEELERAVKQLRAQWLYSMEGVVGQAMLLGRLAIINQLDDFATLPDRIAAVPAAEVSRVVREYLHADNRTVGWFLPTGANGLEVGSVESARAG